MRDETNTHTPKAHPILFNGAMVRAILDGRKTQTRRPITLPVRSASDGGKMRLYTELDLEDLNAALADTSSHKHPHHKIPSLRKPGDLLWVRETWRTYNAHNECACYDQCVCPPTGTVLYRADSDSQDQWTPSIHMPRWASRLTLLVTAVRVERLHAIDEAGARAEGCIASPFGDPANKVATLRAGGFEPPGVVGVTALSAYRNLWESIYGAGSWALNPFVSVTSFKVQP